jgi:hypothetical protein
MWLVCPTSSFCTTGSRSCSKQCVASRCSMASSRPQHGRVAPHPAYSSSEDESCCSHHIQARHRTPAHSPRDPSTQPMQLYTAQHVLRLLAQQHGHCRTNTTEPSSFSPDGSNSCGSQRLPHAAACPPAPRRAPSAVVLLPAHEVSPCCQDKVVACLYPSVSQPVPMKFHRCQPAGSVPSGH